MEEKSTKTMVENEDFPEGHPSWHCTRPGMLNFGVKYIGPYPAASLASVRL